MLFFGYPGSVLVQLNLQALFQEFQIDESFEMVKVKGFGYEFGGSPFEAFNSDNMFVNACHHDNVRGLPHLLDAVQDL